MRIALLVAAFFAAITATSASAEAICSVGDKAQVTWKGNLYPAKVTKVNEDQTKCFIHYDGYGTEWDEWVGQDRIQITGKGSSSSFKVSDDVQVKWKGQWYPASVISAKDGKWKIHYDGYDSSWDEWVGADRIKPR